MEPTRSGYQKYENAATNDHDSRWLGLLGSDMFLTSKSKKCIEPKTKPSCGLCACCVHQPPTHQRTLLQGHASFRQVLQTPFDAGLLNVRTPQLFVYQEFSCCYGFCLTTLPPDLQMPGYKVRLNHLPSTQCWTSSVLTSAAVGRRERERGGEGERERERQKEGSAFDTILETYARNTCRRGSHKQIKRPGKAARFR